MQQTEILDQIPTENLSLIEKTILDELYNLLLSWHEPITLSDAIRITQTDIQEPDDYIYSYTLEQFNAFITKHNLA